MSNIQYTWYDLDRHVAAMCNKMSGQKFDAVIGLTRGGLVPGVLFSHHFNVPFVPVQWSTRDHVQRKLIDFLPQIGGKYLVVDDICDSGITFETLSAELVKQYPQNEFKYAALIQNMEASFVCNVFGEQIWRSKTPQFFDFPWEFKLG